MPSSKRKGVPGRSTLPSDYVHANPLMMGSLQNPLLQQLLQHPVSLGQLGQLGNAPLALTYNAASSAGRATSVAQRVLA